MSDRIYIPGRDELVPTPPDAPLPGKYASLPIGDNVWEACCIDCWRLIFGVGDRYIKPYRCPNCQEKKS